MDRIIGIFLLVMLGSCLAKESDRRGFDGSEKVVSVEGGVIQTFRDVDSLLRIDDGGFWGHQIYGPILIVDPDSRGFFANENNLLGEFKSMNGVFVDTLPENINIANTALDWENKRWSMVMLPLPEGKTSRNNLIIHELFHRIQPEIGFDSLQEFDNGHLDTYEGRLLLKLELEALKKTLTVNNESLRKLHLTNALTFRGRRQINTERKNAENALELNEGLAEYTAISLSGRNEKEMMAHFTKSIDHLYTNPTYVRSFAYQTTPIYGYLLYQSKANWHKEITSTSNLTEFFTTAFAIEIADDKSLDQIAAQNDYNYQSIMATERVRENKRLVKIEGYKTKFLKEPTLKLLFENMNISFDPRNITPLENSGTVYPNIRVTDNFGILTVENGALLSSDWSYIIVSVPTEIGDTIVKGEGWRLELSEGWEVVEVEGGFEVRGE